MSVSIASILSSTKKLATAEQILPDLLRLLKNPNTDTEHINQLLKKDPALMAQVIRLSNGIYYGGSGSCSTIEEAVKRVGYNEIYKMVGAVASVSLMSKGVSLYHMQPGEMWRNSLFTAVLMGRLASKLDQNEDVAYTVGLLSDFGKVVINNYFGNRNIPGYDKKKQSLSEETEEALWGFNNAEVAAELMKKWNFDESVIAPVRYQYVPREAPDNPVLPLLLNIMKYCLHLQPLSEPTFEADLSDVHCYFEELGFGEPHFKDAYEKAYELAGDVK